jgi:hypothetical protein
MDSLAAKPVTVYCGLVECYRNDTLVSSEAAYNRDAIALRVDVDVIHSNYAKYSPQDSLSVTYWELTVK